MAELAASDTGAQAVIADTDGLVFELVGKVVLSLGHGADEDTDAFGGGQGVDVVPYTDDIGVETQSDLSAIRWEVVGDGVLDDLQQLFLGVDRSNGEAMEQLDHETRKALEGSRDSHGRADLDQDALGGVDEDLQFAGLVDGRVEESEKTLMGDVGSGVTNVAAHLAHDSDVFIAVEERIFLFFAAWLSAAVGCSVGLETGIGQDDNQSSGVLVARGDGHVLLGNQSGEFRWGK